MKGSKHRSRALGLQADKESSRLDSPS